MNVTCPQCNTIFRVDPAKVPERGVRARCSVCAGLIAVRRPPLATPAITEPRRAETIPPAPQAEAAPPAPPAQPVAPPPPPPPPPPAPELPPVAPERVVVEREPEAPPPPAEPKQVEAPPEPAAPASGRFANPFLQQDPSTRARRLARALVSDLVVYHPEKRQRGLSEGTLKELFAEEIRKSWEEYTEQVGNELASSTPYFTEALNEILAEGRHIFD
jgi:predicted Zn finger-like uncharacterized protein